MRQEHYADTTSGEQRYDVVYRPITHDNPSCGRIRLHGIIRP
jgi:hypothetical protein